MNKTARQYMTELLIKFGYAFQLPEPQAEYIDTIYNALHENKWTIKEFANVLNILVSDTEYSKSARFGKYPILYDFLRIKKQIKSKDFYDTLSSYLSGEWWKKDEILAIATEAQMNAITTSGGLSKLYERANGEMSTPVYKLMDIVSRNESDSPTEIIGTDNRIGAPKTLKQITQNIQEQARGGKK